MTWLTWRLHRTEAAIGLLLFAALVVAMALATRAIDAAYFAARDGDCFDAFESPRGLACADLLADYWNRSSLWQNLTPLLHGVPLAVALLLIFPTLQELERGTHRLAWTQSVPRRRWAAIRLGVAVGVALFVAALWTVTAADWRESLLRENADSFGLGTVLSGSVLGSLATYARFGSAHFDLSPAVLVGYTLFAVALAFAAAVVLRRVVPVLAVVAVGFAAVRLGTAFGLRPRFRRPVEEFADPAAPTVPRVAPGDWLLDESWLDRAGDRISWERMYELCQPDSNDAVAETFFQRCYADNGLRYYLAYHPAERFAQFQALETALFVGLAAALLAFAYRWLTRRPA